MFNEVLVDSICKGAYPCDRINTHIHAHFIHTATRIGKHTHYALLLEMILQTEGSSNVTFLEDTPN